MMRNEHWDKLYNLLRKIEQEIADMMWAQRPADEQYYIADKLIEHGVTFAEWIPASKPPEEWKREDGTLINYMIYDPAYGIADIGNYHKLAGIWLCMGLPCHPTHWAPLPEPPEKEET